MRDGGGMESPHVFPSSSGTPGYTFTKRWFGGKVSR